MLYAKQLVKILTEHDIYISIDAVFVIMESKVLHAKTRYPEMRLRQLCDHHSIALKGQRSRHSSLHLTLSKRVLVFSRSLVPIMAVGAPEV